MVQAVDRLDVTNLTEAITILASPQQYTSEQKQQAQAYLVQFMEQNAARLHMFFLTYYEFSETTQP